MTAKFDTSHDSNLLSESYRQLNAELHRRDPNYGTTGRRYVQTIRSLAHQYSARTILDYGCGKCDLSNALSREFVVRNFDPAIPEFASAPEPAELVACIDVLEHVEPDYLENVLADLARVTVKVAFFAIATRPSGKHLADGSNCHRILRNSAWWKQQFERHFQGVSAHDSFDGNSLRVIAVPISRASDRGA